LKKLALLLPLLSLNCFAEESDQDKNYSIGLGIGAMYSGIGTNFSFVSENDLKYISAGCTEYSSATDAACGFGVGWIKTDLFGSKSNKHGFGIYATLIGKERPPSSIVYDVQDYYGAGVSYTYFTNGINQSGVTFGASIHATNAEYDGRYGAFFQIGYQF
tara:strand:+ start:680 stop:1159 length:480 start_codon:yes stop_codon:yes gene_type:complete